MSAFAHFELQLDGSEQSLLDAYLAVYPSPRDDSPGPAVRALLIQADPTNSNPVFLGSEGVSTSSYAVRIPVPVTGVPAAPLVIGEFETGGIKLGEYRVIGTDSESIHVGVIIF